MLSIATLTRPRDGGDDCGTVKPTYMFPAVVGALVPDAAMFVFYAVERFWLGSSEREIWSTRYFLPRWQDFFDLFNSVPIVAVGMIVAWNLRRRGWLIFFASMLLHIACDLPLHHDDGHRHFWPLIQWRYQSPVSYWDVNHFGRPAAIAELLLFVGCFAWSFKRHADGSIRIGISLLALIHLSFMTFAIMFWSGL